jgi:hypothetical protein
VRIDLTSAQVRALEAAAAGLLYRPAPGEGSHLGIWRIRLGRAVTMSAFRLIDNKLIADGQPLASGAVPAIVTDLGYAVLDELASRGPNPDQKGRP